MTFEFKLKNDGLKEIVTEAILTQLTEETKNALLGAALQHLIEEPRGEYGRPMKSRLTAAFEDSVAQVARKIVNDLLNDEAKGYYVQIEKIVEAGIKKAILNREDMINAVAASVSLSMSRSER
jgi:hypothetical protein